MTAGAVERVVADAGSGGFMIFYCPFNSRFDVIKAFGGIGVKWQRYRFQNNGLESWTSQQ